MLLSLNVGTNSIEAADAATSIVDAALDAGFAEVGPDASEDATVDSGMSDAAIEDAAVDAGAADAGPPDAGPADGGPADVGPRPDVGPYALRAGEQAYRSIQAATGTPLGLGALVDQAAIVPLPFSFQFFGVTYAAGTLLGVTTNGAVFFGAADTTSNNVALPRTVGTRQVIAPLWDATRYTEDVFFSVTPQTLRIVFRGVERQTGLTRPSRYELTLFAGSNRIEVADYEMDPRFSATVGIAMRPALPVNVTVGAPPLANPVFDVENIGSRTSRTGTLWVFWVPQGGPPEYGAMVPYDALIGNIGPGQVAMVQASANSSLRWPSQAGTYDLMVGMTMPGEIDRSNNLLRAGSVIMAP